DTLRYRWAAMNPPPSPDAADDADVYAGSLPLDPALADRFGFVLVLPALEDLSPEARRNVIRSGLEPSGPRKATIDVADLVARSGECAKRCAALQGGWITAYVSALVVPLRQADLVISGRRAAMLATNVAAIHGALLVLGELDPDRADDPAASIA